MASAQQREERQPTNDRSDSIGPRDQHGPPTLDGTIGPPLTGPPTSPISPFTRQEAIRDKYTQPYRGPAQPIQSVITASFSTEERDGHRISALDASRTAFHQEQTVNGNHNDRNWGHGGETGTSGMPGRIGHQPDFGSQSWGMYETGQPRTIQRAFSSPAYLSNNLAMKRNYYHHSASNDHSHQELPSEFMPPKRSKLSASQEEIKTITPKNSFVKTNLESRNSVQVPEGEMWNNGGATRNLISQAQSFPAPPTWNHHKYPNPTPTFLQPPHFTPPGSIGTPPGWHTGDQQMIMGKKESPHTYLLPAAKSPDHPWTSPTSSGKPSHHDTILRSKTSFRIDERNPLLNQHIDKMSFEWQAEPVHPSQGWSTNTEYASRMAIQPLSMTNPHDSSSQAPIKFKHVPLQSSNGPLLLGLPQDKVALSEVLCLIRANIEVFTASQSDVEAPSPGRKYPIILGQVGLRCIHCRNATKASDKVKRAVCYPSSIKRIYRTVIDMKLDHFPHCQFVPIALREKLNKFKSMQSRSTGTTMRYFIKSAHELGMVDGPTGVHIAEQDMIIPAVTEKRNDSMVSANTIMSESGTVSNKSESMMSTESFDTVGSNEGVKIFRGMIPLALPEDKTALSPLRCFLRENVCAFTASEEDIASRAPTTFTVTAGQVGIGCIHCLKLEARLRSNRAICFPFSISRIYQSVADIQRFHLNECAMLPPRLKDEFLALQNASSKGSKGLATRQYWLTSAKKLGLEDTPQGIRFYRDPRKPISEKAVSLDILAQAAFSVTTSSKQLVLPEDKHTIAEFLYVVMEQLQPCRFTEADRNKRRLKSVGCIGVECKHCAGQVDARKFFWSSISAVESNFVSVHTHMLECRMVPPQLKERLIHLKALRKEQTAALKTGSQKAFFARVWERLHNDEETRDDSSHEIESQLSGVRDSTGSYDSASGIQAV